MIRPLEVDTDDNGTERQRYVFENGWGASVIRGPYSYGGEDGLWELAVMHGMLGSEESHVCYRTPITEDVVGNLTEDEVQVLVAQIAALPYSDPAACPDVDALENALKSLRAFGEYMGLS